MLSSPAAVTERTYMSDAIRFLLNGNLVEVDGLSPQTTLLEYLRERAGLPGTKEGCAEGDCGACTVDRSPTRMRDGGLRYRPINACIRLLPTVDGKAVYTVESLQGADGALHPVQQAMVDCHGSQCGFCTPGFVMSLFGLYKSCVAADERHGAIGCVVRQPVPVHGLPADPRRGRRDVRPAGARRLAWPGRRGRRHPAHRARRRDDGRVARARSPATRTFDYEASGQRFLAPTTMRRAGAPRRRDPRRTHSRRRDRRRPLGHQGAPRSARPDPRRRRARARRDARDRGRARHRRRRDACRCVRRRSTPNGPSSPKRWQRFALGADPQCRHAVRQRRQRLADRRLRCRR